MRIRDPKDFWAGILFIAFGIAAIAIGSNYPLGTAARMGPGYFPRILGVLLIGLGGLLSARGMRTQGVALARFHWKPLLIILGSLTLFGLMLNTLGLVASTLMLIILSSLASSDFTWRAAIIGGVLLAVFTVVAFSYGLKLQFPIWPKFLGA